jgi:hypothetical protein
VFAAVMVAAAVGAIALIYVRTGGKLGAGVETIVWRSEVEAGRVNTDTPVPMFSTDEIELAIDLVAKVPGDDRLCRDALQFAPDAPDELDSCLIVQYRFDTHLDISDPVTVRAIGIVNERGAEYLPLAAETLVAYGGAVDTLGSALFPNSGPGSTVRIAVQGADPTEIEFEVPSKGFDQVPWSVGRVADDRL